MKLRQLWTIFALTVGLMSVLAFPITAQDAAGAQTTAEPVASAELNAQMDQLVALTEQIRGLDTITPVERAFPSREQTIDYLSRQYDETLPQADLERTQAFYVSLGMLEPDTDLRALYLTLLGSQVAGFYDTQTKLMNVLPIGFSSATSLSFSEQIIFVHEYTHALQDQHFQLDALMSAADAINHPDQALALTALIEGDATDTMDVYAQTITMQNPMTGLLLLADSLQAGSLTLPPGIPATLIRELMFPYESGAAFVAHLYQDGGWDAVNLAYDPARLPQTTEQILHVEKYLTGEGAQTVSTVDLTNTLPDWTTLFDGSIGEFYLREHLRSIGLGAGTANNAAAGWGGDRFQLLQAESGDLAWTLTLTWDTPADQSEFESAYRHGAEEWQASPDGDCWTTGTDVRCLVSSGDQTIVISVPTGDLAMQIAAAVNP